MNDAPRTTAPSRGRAIFFCLVIFIAGSIFGSALTIGVGRRVIQRTNHTTTWNVEAMGRLDRRLNLTPEQRAEVQPILVDMLLRMRDIRQQSRRDWTSVLQETREKLRAELTPEQQAEFDKIVRRTRENFGRFLGAPPEPGRAPNSPRPARPSE